jgi:ParB family chromosome partitioning protein
VKAQLEGGELSAGHARAVLSVGGPDEQVDFAREIAADRVTKSEAERRAQVRRVSGGKRGPRTRPRTDDPQLRAVVDDLTRSLGTRVRIAPRAKGGVIEIEFYSDAELTRLVDRLRGPERARAF